MKKIIFFIAFALFGTYCVAQQLQPDQVPQFVKERLQFKFPQTIDIPVSWSKEKGNYKASITIMDKPAFMVIDSLGNIIRIERRIHESYLPKKAKDHLKSLDPKYQIIDVIQFTDNNDKATYKVVAKITENFSFETDGTLSGKK